MIENPARCIPVPLCKVHYFLPIDLPVAVFQKIIQVGEQTGKRRNTCTNPPVCPKNLSSQSLKAYIHESMNYITRQVVQVINNSIPTAAFHSVKTESTLDF